MGGLKFICPATGEEVSTGVDVEAESSERLPSSVPPDCPHCPEPHPLGSVKAWVEGEEDAD
jgi:hypothetical protein